MNLVLDGGNNEKQKISTFDVLLIGRPVRCREGSISMIVFFQEFGG